MSGAQFPSPSASAPAGETTLSQTEQTYAKKDQAYTLALQTYTDALEGTIETVATVATAAQKLQEATQERARLALPALRERIASGQDHDEVFAEASKAINGPHFNYARQLFGLLIENNAKLPEIRALCDSVTNYGPDMTLYMRLRVIHKSLPKQEGKAR